MDRLDKIKAQALNYEDIIDKCKESGKNGPTPCSIEKILTP